MYIIRGNSQNRPFKYNTACALGFFDGVHRGHASLIYEVKRFSERYGLKSMIFTFEKHPLTILSPENAPKLITDNETKSEIFEQFGVDIVNFNSVNNEFLNYGPEMFLSEILIKKFNAKALAAGFNFRFGHNGAGDSHFLSDYCNAHNIPVCILNPYVVDGMVVSSSSIREYIKNGDIPKANKLLGRNFSIEGYVSHGMMRGRKLGFKTANLSVNDCMAIPKSGVYVTSIDIDGVLYGGVTNVGTNPTFRNNKTTIETHVLDYNREIYDKKIRVYFHERLRDEFSFKDVNELSNQISKDKQCALEYLIKNRCLVLKS